MKLTHHLSSTVRIDVVCFHANGQDSKYERRQEVDGVTWFSFCPTRLNRYVVVDHLFAKKLESEFQQQVVLSPA